MSEQLRPRRFLFTNWECGGHVDPALIVARQCLLQGHAVLFVSDEANRRAAASLGVPFQPWRSAPNRTVAMGPDLKDWRARTPLGAVDTICRDVIIGPAPAYAHDVARHIEEFDPDLIVSNELLFGCVLAAERAGTPCALLTGNVWCFPTRADVPPFGPGFQRSSSDFAVGRDRWTARLLQWAFNRHTRELNAVRAGLGLQPLARFLDQLDYPASVVLGVAKAFDIGAAPPPPGFFYAGPLIRTPTWVRDQAYETALFPGRPEAPRVLVSFSTTPQGQARVVARCIKALSRLPVSAVVTLGPAVGAERMPGAANVAVVDSASHDALAPGCAAMICHAGHGTLIRPLMHGVPVLCLPMGRDQADNSARTVSGGAGIRLSPHAGPARIARAVQALVNQPQYRRNAAALGQAVRSEVDGGAAAARHLAGLAGGGQVSGELRDDAVVEPLARDSPARDSPDLDSPDLDSPDLDSLGREPPRRVQGRALARLERS